MSDDGVRIDDADPADLPALRAIQASALAEPAPDLLAATVRGAGLALLATTDQPVGYVIALLAGDTAYVPELAVRAEYRRRGIGGRLLAVVANRAREAGVAELRLTVRADDERARTFYRDQGFTQVERHPDYFETGSGVGLTLARSL